jgi:hypothetical protein
LPLSIFSVATWIKMLCGQLKRSRLMVLTALRSSGSLMLQIRKVAAIAWIQLAVWLISEAKKTLRLTRSGIDYSVSSVGHIPNIYRVAGACGATRFSPTTTLLR